MQAYPNMKRALTGRCQVVLMSTADCKTTLPLLSVCSHCCPHNLPINFIDAALPAVSKMTGCHSVSLLPLLPTHFTQSPCKDAAGTSSTVSPWCARGQCVIVSRVGAFLTGLANSASINIEPSWSHCRTHHTPRDRSLDRCVRCFPEFPT